MVKVGDLVKDLSNWEIQQFIDKNKTLESKCVMDFFSYVHEGYNHIDNKRLMKIFQRLFTPTPRDVRLAVDDTKTKDYQSHLLCGSSTCPVEDNVIICDKCSMYKKHKSIREAYQEAISLRVDSARVLIFHESFLCILSSDLFIRQDNKDIAYINSCFIDT